MATLSLSPSSNIQGAEYDAQTHTLTVTFHGGRSWRHSSVDPDTITAFEAAPSAGGFYASVIRRFPCARV